MTIDAITAVNTEAEAEAVLRRYDDEGGVQWLEDEYGLEAAYIAPDGGPRDDLVALIADGLRYRAGVTS